MTHKATSTFWRLYHALPPEIRGAAPRQFARLLSDPRHPSIQFKPIRDAVYSARVTLDYRALATKIDDETFEWSWIGRHSRYDRILDNL